MKWLKRIRPISTLGQWLEVAAGGLCDEARERVEAEIREHYDAAVAMLIEAGAAEADAKEQALDALGNANTARRRLERIHLTQKEDKGLSRFEGQLSNSGFITLNRVMLAAMVLSLGLWLIMYSLPITSDAVRLWVIFMFIGMIPMFFCVSVLFPWKRNRISRSAIWAVHEVTLGFYLLMAGAGWYIESHYFLRLAILVFAGLLLLGIPAQLRFYFKLRRLEHGESENGDGLTQRR